MFTNTYFANYFGDTYFVSNGAVGEVLTMCLSSIALYAAILADSVSISNSILSSSASLYPVAEAASASQSNSMGADDAELFAC